MSSSFDDLPLKYNEDFSSTMKCSASFVSDEVLFAFSCAFAKLLISLLRHCVYEYVSSLLFVTIVIIKMYVDACVDIGNMSHM